MTLVASGWHLAHLLCLAAWGGLGAGEAVLEILGRKKSSLAAPVARLHFWMDLLVELPLLLGVGLTGGVLLHGVAFEGLLLVKVLAGLGAVVSNLACLALVVHRARLGPAASSEATTRWIFRTAIFGMPLALVALYLGGRSAGWFA